MEVYEYEHATIKLHKHNGLIRSIIKWENAPASYKLAKQLSKILHSYLQLPHSYNVQNSMHLMMDRGFAGYRVRKASWGGGMLSCSV